jgi:lysozyme family protein
MRYSNIWPRYAQYWNKMAIFASALHEFTVEAQVAIAHKAIYQQIEAATGVPWAMTAVLHRRESNANFGTYLGNGQSLAHITSMVPAGRGPFFGPNAFVNGAIDAYRVEGWGSVKDWRLEKILYFCLLFNGVGSEAWGHPSSYIWGLTNIQQPGKWVRDHDWDPNYMDTQPGCAPLLATILRLDPSVQFVRETPPEVPAAALIAQTPRKKSK